MCVQPTEIMLVEIQKTKESLDKSQYVEVPKKYCYWGGTSSFTTIDAFQKIKGIYKKHLVLKIETIAIQEEFKLSRKRVNDETL